MPPSWGAELIHIPLASVQDQLRGWNNFRVQGFSRLRFRLLQWYDPLGGGEGVHNVS